MKNLKKLSREDLRLLSGGKFAVERSKAHCVCSMSPKTVTVIVDSVLTSDILAAGEQACGGPVAGCVTNNT